MSSRWSPLLLLLIVPVAANAQEKQKPPNVPVPVPAPVPQPVPPPAPEPPPPAPPPPVAAPPPPPAPAPVAVVVAPAPEEPSKILAGGHILMALPRAFLDGTARSSSGLRLFGTYSFFGDVSAIASFDYVFLRNQPQTPASVSLDIYAFDVGVRIRNRLVRGLMFYFEAEVGLHGVSASGITPDPSAVGLGFRFGTGVEVEITSRIFSAAQISYSMASVNSSGPDNNVEFLPIEVGAGYRF